MAIEISKDKQYLLEARIPGNDFENGFYHTQILLYVPQTFVVGFDPTSNYDDKGALDFYSENPDDFEKMERSIKGEKVSILGDLKWDEVSLELPLEIRVAESERHNILVEKFPITYLNEVEISHEIIIDLTHRGRQFKKARQDLYSVGKRLRDAISGVKRQ